MTKIMVIFMLIVWWNSGMSARGDEVELNVVVEAVMAPADGYSRAVIGVFAADSEGNPVYEEQQPVFPGPLLRAAQGDTVQVRLFNRLEAPVSLHFHGVHMVANPWADGVLGVTECGAPPAATGVSSSYRFNVTQTGSFWYHAHSAAQYLDGLLGPIIFDYPPGHSDPVKSLYDYGQADYFLVLQEWWHERSADLLTLATAPSDMYAGFQPGYPWPPPSVLLNGRGSNTCAFFDNCSLADFNWVECPGHTIDKSNPQCILSRPSMVQPCQPTSPYPAPTFVCPAGGFARLRLVNGGTETALRFWVDSHPMLLVARDGTEVTPTPTRFLTLNVGQRFDVIVACNMSTPDQSPVAYSIFVTLAPDPFYLGCGGNYFPFVASALLLYNALPQQDPASIPLVPPFPDPTVNYTGPDYEDQKGLFEYTLAPTDPALATAAPADEQLVVQFRGVSVSGQYSQPLELWAVNNKSFILPPSGAPLLQQIYQNPNVTDQLTPDNADFFLPTTLKLTAGKTYQVALVSDSRGEHPWHIHGYSLQFVGVTTNASDLNGLLAQYPLAAALPTIAYGDSFTVPSPGAVIFRFKADNGGPWLFHCHIEWHLTMGMGLVLSVEQADGSGYAGLIQPPPADARLCGPAQLWSACLPPDEGNGGDGGGGSNSPANNHHWSFLQIAIVSVLSLAVLILALVLVIIVCHHRNKKKNKQYMRMQFEQLS